MNGDETLRKQVCQALDDCLSGVDATPSVRSDLLRQIRGETKMKKKLTTGFVLALVLALLAVGGIAAALLSGQQIVEEKAVPLAKSNDTATRLTTTFTHDELVALVKTLDENGITLSENSQILTALKTGEGYYEEETIMEICREAFGGLFYEWTIEQQHWFQEMMIEIGFAQSNPYALPDATDMTAEQAQAHAVSLLRAKYGAELALDDKESYRVSPSFGKEMDDNGNYSEPSWRFDFYPKKLTLGEYSVSFDRAGEVSDSYGNVRAWTDYTADDLINGINAVYGYRTYTMRSWTQEAWHVLDEMLDGAKQDAEPTPEIKGYLETHYPLISAADLSLEQATETAKQALNVQDARTDAAVLMENEGQRVWKVTLIKPDGGSVFAELDSQTGAALVTGEFSKDDPQCARYLLKATYERVFDGQMKQSDAVALAAKGIREAANNNDLPLEQEEFYTVDVYFMERNGRWTVLFKTKTLAYGTCSANVTADGTVNVLRLDADALSGDNLFARYNEVHGNFSTWTQETWVAMSNEMQRLTATTLSARLIQATHYVSLENSRLTREQAVDIAIKDLAQPAEDAYSAVLIQGEKNTFWKLRLFADPTDVLYEIDAQTGEILDKELFKPDNSQFDPPCKLYVPHRLYTAAVLNEQGAVPLAVNAVTKAYADMRLDDPTLPVLDEQRYKTTVDGRTVTFTPLMDEPSYLVVLDEDGMTVSVNKQ